MFKYCDTTLTMVNNIINDWTKRRAYHVCTYYSNR